ncbi:hypothetical protein D3C78_1527410 [compost metagenome]
MLHADPLLAGEILRGQHALLCQRMVLGQGQQHRVVQHLETQQVRVVVRRRLTDQGNIETTLAQALELFGGALVVQRNVHVRAVGP